MRRLRNLLVFLVGLFLIQLFVSHRISTQNQAFSVHLPLSEFNSFPKQNQVVHKDYDNKEIERAESSVVEPPATIVEPPAAVVLTPTTTPFWSIILTGRNDKYGATYINRLNNFVKNIGYLITKYSLSAELIITEWNPLEGQPSLADVIDWSAFMGSSDTVRIITVSNSIHQTFKQSDLFSVHEFVGKNVAARRARGSWLLFSNSDNIFNEEIGQFLHDHSSLDENCYYRASRIDFSGNIDTLNPSQFWETCMGSAFRIGRQGWQNFEDKSTRESFWKEWNNEIQMTAKDKHMECSHPSRLVGGYNTMAAGDWTAFNKAKFVQLKGFVEAETYGGWDSVMLMIASCTILVLAWSNIALVELGMCQCNLLAPYATCHQDHPRDQNSQLPPTLYGPIWNDVMSGRSPQINTQSWGLANYADLPEARLVNGKWVHSQADSSKT